jgi:hypothetical protein
MHTLSCAQPLQMSYPSPYSQVMAMTNVTPDSGTPEAVEKLLHPGHESAKVQSRRARR